MFKTLKNAFKDKDIRKKLFITLGLLGLYILGTWIPVPGIATSVFQSSTTSNTFLTLLNSVSGGALANGAILALGVSPYITASIIIQLLAVAIPSLEKLSKQGEEGQKKINSYTRIASLVLAIAQAIGIVVSFNSQASAIEPIFFGNSTLTGVFIVFVLVAGAMFTVWLGEKITETGIGNGVSLLIYIGILSSASVALLQTITGIFSNSGNIDQLWNLIIFLIAVVIIFGLIVFIDLAERKIPVTYAKQIRGRRLVGGQSTELSLKVNSGGVMPIIFASALISFPQLIMSIFWPTSDAYAWYSQYLGAGSWVYSVILAVLILFFAFFYSQITFNPEEVAKRIQENGGMIATYRPGKPTVEYLRKVNNRIVLFGAIFLAFLALVPTLIFTAIASDSSLINAFTATGMIIIVSCALEFNKQLEDQMIVRNYRGFLK